MPRLFTGAGGRRAGSAFLEMSLVVVGVLIAFGLDSWWDRRTEAARETAYLRALYTDFDANARLLDQHIASQRAVLDATRRLVELIREYGPTAPDDSVRGRLANVFSSARLQPVLGTYDALVASGELTLIGDATLRNQLASFKATVDDHPWQRIADHQYEALMHEFIGELSPAFFRLPDATPAEPADAFDAVLADPRFRGQLVLRFYAEREMLRIYEDLQARVDSILHRLRRLLAARGVDPAAVTDSGPPARATGVTGRAPTAGPTLRPPAAHRTLYPVFAVPGIVATGTPAGRRPPHPRR